jgi:signal transduction histidine kinase/DNA-binding response OmpR family regulator
MMNTTASLKSASDRKELYVLIVEDSLLDAGLMVRELKSLGYSILWRRVDTAAALREALSSQPWDVVLSDYAMPHFSSLEALNILKAGGLDLPFILVSGTIGEEIAVEAMRAGAHDYLLKDRLARLGPAVERELREAEGRRARKQAEHQLASRAAELIALNKLARQVSVDLKVAAVIETALAHTLEAVTPDLVVLFVKEGDGLNLRGIYPGDRLNGGGDIPAHRVGECLCGLAVRQGEAVFSENIHTDSRCTLDDCKQAGICSFAALPLEGGGEILGVVGIATTSTRNFAEQATFLEALANEVAIGLRNAILHEKVQEHAQELEARLIQIKQGEQERANLQRQLQQLQKMEAIGTLAGGIAHDFNNMLTPIIAGTETAQAKIPADHPAQSCLRYVIQAGLRARDLVQQILTFSRRSEDERMPLNVIPVVKEVTKLLRASIPSTIEMRQVLAAPRDTVFANPTHIHQIVMNLCTNAAHAMREGGGILEIGITNEILDESAACRYPEVAPGEYLVLTVRDTGHGMDSMTKERIFEPFFTTKGRGEGTGMGLSVAHGIVVGCGGTISVESEPGRGSIFRVMIPCIREKPVLVGESREAPMTGSGRIMFIDDEALIAEMYQEMLGSLGYEVEAFTDPARALEALGADPSRFDLVITDQTMPGMTGLQLIQAIRRLGFDIPIILCTGLGGGLSPDTTAGLGVREFLMKPIPRVQMARAVDNVLRTRYA